MATTLVAVKSKPGATRTPLEPSFLERFLSIARRIRDAERSATGTTTGDHHRLWCELVGRRDALFWPWRDATNALPVVQRRRAFLAGAEGIAVRADGRAAWKPSHEARRQLLDAGWATGRFASGQVTSLFVTEAGDAVARAIVGDLPGPLDSLLPLARLRVYTGKPFCGRDWVAEADLFDLPPDADCPRDWDRESGRILPALVRGWADSRCDAYGRIYFTPATDVAIPELVDSDAAEHPDAWDWYIAAFKAERDALRVAEPADPAEIVVPLPASW